MSSSPLGRPLLLDVAIALVSAAVLLLQISLTRILSVTLWYHFSFLAISMAMLGLGLGSALAASQARPRMEPCGHAALFALTTPACVFYAMGLVPPPVTDARLPVIGLTLNLAMLVIPFTFAGACIAAMLRVHAERISRLYAWDLAGAAAAALVAIPLLDRITAPDVTLLAALAAAAGAVALRAAGGESRGFPRLVPAATLAVVAMLLLANSATGWLGVRHTKGNTETPLLERWSSLARLTVFQIRKYTYRLVLDGCAATAMHRLDHGPEHAVVLRRRGSATAFHLRQEGKAVIVGPGGGEDVVTALTYPGLEVVAVEINPTIIETVDEDFGDVTGRLYEHPRVEVAIMDGRHFFRRNPGAYDIVHLSMVDTFAASAAGAMALSENNLYTVEAFDAYLDNLGPDGILSVTWWKHATPTIAARLVTLSRTALEHAGATEPAKHLAVLEHDRPPQIRMTLLAKRSPFTAGERAAMRALVEDNDWTLVHPAPEGVEPDPLMTFVSGSADERRDLSQRMGAFLEAPTDDRPFLFYTHGWDAYRPGRARKGGDPVVGWVPVFMLATLLYATLAAGAAAVAWPWIGKVSWRGAAGLPRFAGFFVGLGLGFLAIEALLIQVFVLFLGHPSYALTCVLFSLLLAAGAGSGVAGRRWAVGELTPIRGVCLAIALAMVLLLTLKPWTFAPLARLPLGGRLAVAVLILAPLGFLMGMPFQAGLRALAERAPAGVPWAWAVNAVTSVLGSVVATLIALHEGFTASGWAGAAAYTLAAIALPGVGARRGGRAR